MERELRPYFITKAFNYIESLRILMVTVNMVAYSYNRMKIYC